MPLRRGASGGLRWTARAFWRTALAGSVVGGVCMWQLVLAGSGTATADDSSWVAGSATATSQAVALAPSTAGLNYALTLATSVADYQGNQGQAESETFTGGPVVTAATSTQCDGSAPPVTQSQLPQPAVAESTNGNQSQTYNLNAQYFQGMSAPGSASGFEQAAATTQPAATALSKLSDFQVPGAFDVSGAQSSAYAQQVTGQLRQATGTADVSEVSLGNGAVDLKGLHWDDTQETGPGGAIVKQAASFSIGGLTLGGTAVPVAGDSAAQITQIVNTALASTGLNVTIPQAQTNSSDGTESIPPLAIGINQSALGQQVVGPALGPTETVRDEIDQILEGDITCKTGTPLTVVDILLGALSGGGNLDLNLGGAIADSNGTAYANPFGNSLGLLGAGGGAVSALGTSSPGSSTPGSSGSFTPGSTGSSGSPGSSGTGSKQSLGALSNSVRCVTTSPAGHPSCSDGAGVPVALAGLAAVLGVGTADYLRLRRFRHLTPQDIAR